MKRWNRKNELLADAAERASVAAPWLGGTPYPTEKLYDSWMLTLLECQMHDILPGDCLPKCYEYSWNDEVLAANGFAAAEQDGVGGVAAAMDTLMENRRPGVPLVVYNPLSIARADRRRRRRPSSSPDPVAPAPCRDRAGWAGGAVAGDRPPTGPTGSSLLRRHRARATRSRRLT